MRLSILGIYYTWTLYPVHCALFFCNFIFSIMKSDIIVRKSVTNHSRCFGNYCILVAVWDRKNNCKNCENYTMNKQEACTHQIEWVQSRFKALLCHGTWFASIWANIILRRLFFPFFTCSRWANSKSLASWFDLKNCATLFFQSFVRLNRVIWRRILRIYFGPFSVVNL